MGTTITAAEFAAKSKSYQSDLIKFCGDEEPSDDDSEDWVIRGIIARSAVTMLVADPKVGKTMLMLSWAIAIASGQIEWCGQRIEPDMRGRRVFCFPREDPPRVIKIRIWRLCRYYGIRPRDIADRLGINQTTPLRLDDKESITRLQHTAEEWDVIMIDSLSKIHLKDENSARDMAPMLGLASDMAMSSSTAFVLLHHLGGKGQFEVRPRTFGQKMRGSSSIWAAARWVVGIERREPKNPALGFKLEADGNLEYSPPPFVATLAKTKVGDHAALHYEKLGTVDQKNQQERQEKIRTKSLERQAQMRAQIKQSLDMAEVKLTKREVIQRDDLRMVSGRDVDIVRLLQTMVAEGVVLSCPVTPGPRRKTTDRWFWNHAVPDPYE